MTARSPATVRLAGSADRAAVRELLEEIRSLFGESGGDRDLDRILDDALGGGPLELLVALVAGVPMGLVSITCAPTSQGSGLFAWLDDLYVREPHRRAGIGTQLVEAAVARARERGAGEVRLAAAMGDAGLVNLYRNAGFSVRGQALLVCS